MKNRIVIIGGGIGGLLSAAILSKSGFPVVLLEKNGRVGGSMMSYHLEGGLIETGVHYMGSLDEGQTLNRIFRYVGLLPGLSLSKLDPEGFDRIRFGNHSEEFPIAATYERFSESLLKFFPDARHSMKGYCALIQDFCKRFPMYNLTAGTTHEKIGLMERNAMETIKSYFSNEILQNVLAANNFLYAGNGSSTPFYIHALITNSFIEGAWRCNEGGSQIAKLLKEIIQRHGGEVVTQANVRMIHIENDRVDYVVTEDQKQYHGETFISDLHPSTTIRLTNPQLFRPSYIKRIDSLENSTGVFALNIVFKKQSCPWTDYNEYFHRDYRRVWNSTDYSPHEWPETYALFFSHRKGEWAESASILTYMHFDEVKEWSDSYNTVYCPGDRGSSYADFKASRTMKLLKLVESQHPGFSRYIKSVHTATPLTWRDYTGTPEGSMYGIVRDYRSPLKSLIPVKTRIPNLLLTGQNLNIHGILGVSVSAVITCGEILGLDDLISEIKKV